MGLGDSKDKGCLEVDIIDSSLVAHCDGGGYCDEYSQEEDLAKAVS